MTTTYFPFDAGQGSETLESEWSVLMRWMRTNGILTTASTLTTELEVTADPPDLSVLVDLGKAFINGFYFELYDAAEQLTITENISGDPRIDLVTVELDVDANIIEFVVVEGTPAMSPVAPTPTQNDTIWQLPLAEVLVPDSATEIDPGDITDVRVKSAQGVVVPVCSVRRTTNQSVTNGSNYTISWESVNQDNASMFDVGEPTRVTITEDGYYQVTLNVAWESNASSTGTVDSVIRTVTNGGGSDVARGQATQNAFTSSSGIFSNTIFANLVATDYIYCTARNNSGQTINFRAIGTYVPRLYVVKVGEIS